jgi:N-acetylmuramoyl-L-alanine amidase
VLVADYDIVLDPGHGGSDAGLMFEGLGSESVLTLNLAEQVAAILRTRGVRATLTRDTDFAVSMDRRSSAGVGADLFVSLHMADLPAGEFNAYYLSDAANVDSLQMAIRNNAADAAEAETDRLRRELLLGLVPDLALGRTMAEGISGRLFALGAYRGASVAGAPLQVLGGAAGRGVLLEFSAADIATSDLAQRLAQALLDQMESMALGGG